MSRIALKVEDIGYEYPDGYNAIDKMSFQINDGEKVGIIGANGAGKSTLLQLLTGLLICKKGKITIDELELNRINLKKIRKKVGFIFQDSENQLFMNTVYDDIAFGLRSSDIAKEEVSEKVDKILEEFSIEYLKDRQINRLSGGQKKSVAIAGIMVMEPKIILMDEPTAALDPKSRREFINLIKDLPQTNIIATHDLDMILDCCERVIILKDGQVVMEGKTEEILRDEALMDNCNLELPLSLYSKRV